MLGIIELKLLPLPSLVHRYLKVRRMSPPWVILVARTVVQPEVEVEVRRRNGNLDRRIKI
jgi:hypothetical protein